MKTTIAVLAGLMLGVVAGAIGVHQWLMPSMVSMEQELFKAQSALADSKAASVSAQDKLARLEQERESFNDRLEAAEKRAEQATYVEPVAPVAADVVLEAAEVDGAAVEDVANEPEDAERRDRGRDRGDRWGGTEEERTARRQEFVTRMQDNMTNFFTGELEKSSTPQMQERLLALEEKTYEMFELRSQRRQAETDEEREQLDRAFGDAMASARQMMVDQQEDMIGAIATQFGISKESDQAAFEQAIRSAISSPFFSDNPGSLLWNAGRPTDGGSSGGGFGGGGFGGGGFGGGGFGGPRGGPGGGGR